MMAAGHFNVVRLRPDLSGLDSFPDGTTYKELTPPGYVEGSFMLKRSGIYYLKWLEAGWIGADYRVAHATGPSALAPFTPRGTILKHDERIMRGAASLDRAAAGDRRLVYRLSASALVGEQGQPPRARDRAAGV